MIRYLLDTDTVTFWLHGHEAVVAAVQSHDIREIAIPIVVIEEVWDGWQAVIRQAKTSERMARAYPQLSATLAGGGIRGGSVYGASDKTAAYVKDNPVSLEDFSATLYHAMGIDPATRLSPDGFTKPASTGRVIAELV